MLQAMRPQLQGTSDKPMLHETWYVIYFYHLCHALCVSIQMYVYITNHLVYHVLTTTANSSLIYCMPSTHRVYLFNI